MKTLIPLLLLSCILSCSKFRDTSQNERIDTLRLLSSKIDSEFNVRFGVAIPTSFEIIDTLSIDLNGDKEIDTIAILEPSYQDSHSSESSSTNENLRYLVEILNLKGESKVRNVYSNIISNIGGVLSKYSGMRKSSPGFTVQHQSGARYSWSYTCEYSTSEKDSIYLTAIYKVCSLDAVDIENRYSYDNLAVKNINVSDSLKVDCKCDKFWKELEERKKDEE